MWRFLTIDHRWWTTFQHAARNSLDISQQVGPFGYFRLQITVGGPHFSMLHVTAIHSRWLIKAESNDITDVQCAGKQSHLCNGQAGQITRVGCARTGGSSKPEAPRTR